MEHLDKDKVDRTADQSIMHKNQDLAYITNSLNFIISPRGKNLSQVCRLLALSGRLAQFTFQPKPR